MSAQPFGQRYPVLDRLRHDRAAVLSVVVISFMFALALLAPLLSTITRHDPIAQDYSPLGMTENGLPVGPSSRYWLGTDDLGRDVLLRVIFGARVSLLVAVLSSIVAIGAGVVVGLVGGYRGGWIDTVVSRLMDVVLSLPALIFAIALVSLVGPNLGVTVIVIAFFSWAWVGRLVRGQTLSLRESEYVQAAETLGASHVRIMFVEILPNLAAPIIVASALLIPSAIGFEAGLSFLGLGVALPAPSWGGMLAESLKYYRVAPWYLCTTGAAILITTMAFNMLGDSLRDAFDARAAALTGSVPARADTDAS
jgi:peptide/nickel transport system permease protein